MINIKNPSILYYYCYGCNKFHSYIDNKDVSRKLCFFCGKKQRSNTKIIGSFGDGKSQICDKCYKKDKVLENYV